MSGWPSLLALTALLALTGVWLLLFLGIGAEFGWCVAATTIGLYGGLFIGVLAVIRWVLKRYPKVLRWRFTADGKAYRFEADIKTGR